MAEMSEYERGQRDMLNSLLALNPEVSMALAKVSGGVADSYGRLPFDVAFWITAVAEQLGIEPKDDALTASPAQHGEPRDE